MDKVYLDHPLFLDYCEDSQDVCELSVKYLKKGGRENPILCKLQYEVVLKNRYMQNYGNK